MVARNEDLLRPTLSDIRVAKAPYSDSMQFISAFLGGFFAAAIVTALNAWRLQRLGRDLPVIAICCIVYLAILMGLFWSEQGAAILTELNAFAGDRSLRTLIQLLGLAMFGIGYAMHRKEQRGANLTDLPRPNPWIAGIACIVVGIPLNGGLIAALQMLGAPQ